MRVVMWIGVSCPCPSIRNDIVTPCYLFPSLYHLTILILEAGSVADWSIRVQQSREWIMRTRNRDFFPETKISVVKSNIYLKDHFTRYCHIYCFLVACTRLYNPLCPSVSRLVGRSVTLHFFLWFYFFDLTAPAQMVWWPQIWPLPTRKWLR